MTIDPLEYSLRAHEVLEDGIHLQLSGRRARGAASALVALRAEVEGTNVVLQHAASRCSPAATPAAPCRRRGARCAVSRRRSSGCERADGSLPRWDRLGQRDRELVDGLTAGAAEQLAYVPELIDPRPPRPAQRSFGDGG